MTDTILVLTEDTLASADVANLVSLHPDEEPTASILPKWLARHGLGPTAAALLTRLNAELGNRDFAIGPSYFMKDKVQSKDSLQRVWRSSILPLLEEHYYGNWPIHVKRFEFAKLWAATTVTVAAPSEPEVNDVELTGPVGADDVEAN